MSTSAPLPKPPAVFLTIPTQCVVPETCANCIGPAETHARVACQVMRTTRTYQVPSEDEATTEHCWDACSPEGAND